MSSKSNTLFQAFLDNFLGNAPLWYKQTILVFLVINPLMLVVIGPFWKG